jgi:hypothetical protein
MLNMFAMVAKGFFQEWNSSLRFASKSRSPKAHSAPGQCKPFVTLENRIYSGCPGCPANAADRYRAALIVRWRRWACWGRSRNQSKLRNSLRMQLPSAMLPLRIARIQDGDVVSVAFGSFIQRLYRILDQIQDRNPAPIYGEPDY